MRIEASVRVRAPREAVWEQVGDVAGHEHLIRGITRWEHLRGPRSELGARYSMRMRVGSADVGSEVEIVEYLDGHELAWASVTGVSQRGRWRLKEDGQGSTLVTLRIYYASPGNILGRIADVASSPMVRGNVRATLDDLRRTVEAEHMRRRREAARRRRTTA